MGNPFYAASVDDFVTDLYNGRIQGVSARPALTRDIFDLYRAWCSRKRIPQLGSVSPLIKLIGARQAIPLLRKRYAIDGELLGPHGIMFLSSPPPPRAGYECDWLGEHIVAFKASVDAYSARNLGASLLQPSLELVKK